MKPEIFVAIDEHGRALINEKRIESFENLEELFQNLHFLESGALASRFQGETCYVEAFEAPWVFVDLQWTGQQLLGLNTYGLSQALDLKETYFDSWDRLHGVIQKTGLHWVMSRSAQEKFFELLEDFDDHSFTFQGVQYTPRPQYESENSIDKSQWWTDVYLEPKGPGWDMGSPHPALKDMLPRLKLPRSRILNLGCGAGHDAAYLASEGHLVTAVDFSPEAMTRAQKLYQQHPLQFLQADAFQLPRHFDKAFDFVFEHTFFCAVSPEKRSELVKVWNRCLVQGGYFMGVFFAVEKRSGPPFGSTEWEIRQRLEKDFHILFWGRWRTPFGQRLGRELFVLMQKK